MDVEVMLVLGEESNKETKRVIHPYSKIPEMVGKTPSMLKRLHKTPVTE